MMRDATNRPLPDNLDRLVSVWRGRRSGELVLWLRGERPVRAPVTHGGLVRPAQVVLLSQAVTRGRLRFEPGPPRGAGRRRAIARVAFAAARRLGEGPLPEHRLALGLPPAELRELVGDAVVERLTGRRFTADALLREGTLGRAELVALVRIGALIEATVDESEEAETVGFRPVSWDATYSVPPSVLPPPEVPGPRAPRRVTVRLGQPSPLEDESVGPDEPAICFVAGIERGPALLQSPVTGEVRPVRPEAPTEEVVPVSAPPAPEPAPELAAAPLSEDEDVTCEPTLAPGAVAVEARPAPLGLPRVPLVVAPSAVPGIPAEVVAVQEILVERARDSLELGELGEAHDVLLRAVQLHPGNPRVLVHLAWTEALMDPAARDVILQRVYAAVTHAPDDPVVHGFAAEISYVLRCG